MKDILALTYTYLKICKWTTDTWLAWMILFIRWCEKRNRKKKPRRRFQSFLLYMRPRHLPSSPQGKTGVVTMLGSRSFCWAMLHTMIKFTSVITRLCFRQRGAWWWWCEWVGAAKDEGCEHKGHRNNGAGVFLTLRGLNLWAGCLPLLRNVTFYEILVWSCHCGTIRCTEIYYDRKKKRLFRERRCYFPREVFECRI